MSLHLKMKTGKGGIDVANKGWTKGGFTSLGIDAALLIGSFVPVTAPYVAHIAIPYAIGKFGGDMAGFDLIDYFDKNLYDK
jgi:hypothetical protein